MWKDVHFILSTEENVLGNTYIVFICKRTKLIIYEIMYAF